MGESFDEGLLVLNEMGDWKYVGGRVIPGRRSMRYVRYLCDALSGIAGHVSGYCPFLSQYMQMIGCGIRLVASETLVRPGSESGKGKR